MKNIAAGMNRTVRKFDDISAMLAYSFKNVPDSVKKCNEFVITIKINPKAKRVSRSK